MKISIDIELSPQEAREFFGLPDVRAVQQKMLEELSEQMRQGTLSGYDPLQLMKPLFPAQMQSLEALQQAFWQAFQNAEQNAASGESAASGGAADAEADSAGTNTGGRKRTARGKKT